MTAVLAARRAASSANNDDLEAEIAAEEEALRKEREYSGLELEADFERLEKKKAALAKATADARASLMDEIAADEEALREERERLAAAKEAYRLEAVHFLFDWERIHAEDCRDDLPLRDTVQPPVLTEGDKRQASIQTPRTERAWQTSSLAGRSAGRPDARRAVGQPEGLRPSIWGRTGGMGAAPGRWYVTRSVRACNVAPSRLDGGTRVAGTPSPRRSRRHPACHVCFDGAVPGTARAVNPVVAGGAPAPP